MLTIICDIMPELQIRLQKSKVKGNTAKLMGLNIVYETFLKQFFSKRSAEILDLQPIDLPSGYDLF